MIPRGPDPGTPGAPGSPVVTMLNSAVCSIAAPIAAVTAVSWLLTFTPWARFMPDVFFVPLFFLTFPLFGWSVFVLSIVRLPPGSRRTRWQPADPLKEIPRARVPLALAGVVLIAAMTGTILLLTWRLGLGKPVPAVPPGQDVLGAA